MAKNSKSLFKGVYKLNPTKMVLKQSSMAARKGVTSNVPGFKKVKKVKGLNK